MSKGNQPEIEGLRAELKRRQREHEAALRAQDEQRAALLHILEDLAHEQGLVEQARQEWTAVIDAIQDPIFLHDREFRVVRANRAYAARAGMDFKAIIGRPYWEVFPKNSGPLANCARALEEEEEEEEEEEVTLPSGEVFVSRVFPIRSADGAYLYSIHVLEDVTEKRRAQAALEASEHAYRTLAQNLPGIVYRVYVREGNRMQFFNRMAEAVTGYTAEELSAGEVCSIDPLIVPEDRSQVIAEVQRALVERRPFTVEYRLRTKGGDTRHMLEQGIPISGPDGRALYIDGVIFDVTERQRAEERLRKSAAELNEAQRVARLGNWELDTETGNVTWSEELYRIFGGDPAQPAPGYDEHPRIMTPESYARMNAAIEKTRQTGETYELDLELVRPDGTGKWITARGEAKRDFNGQIVGLRGTALDITERKQAEAALAESEARFRAMVESTSDWIWEVDARGVYTYASPKVKELLGYEPAEIVGRTPFDFMPPEEAKRVAETFSGFATARRSFTGLENTNRHKDGHAVVLETSGVPVLNADGTLRGYRGIDRDITERKRAGETLRASEERLRQIGAAAQDAIVMLDDEGRVVYWNPAAERIFGFAASDVQGKDFHSMVAPIRYRDDFHRGWARFREAGEGPVIAKLLELTALRRDGTEFPVELSVSALRMTGRWHAVGIVRDITERRRAEQALHRANRTLKALSACNSALLHAKNEQELLDWMCRVAVDEGGYRLAWIGYAEHDEAKTVRPVAHAGFEEGYLESSNITWADTERGRGPTGRAVRSGTPQASRDIQNDPWYAPWREQALKRGYASSNSLPLKEKDGEVLGVLNVYAADADAFDDAEMRLLTELAGDLAFGILMLRTRAEHNYLQEEHLKAADRIKQALIATVQAVALTVEKRDPYTAGHQQKVAALCVAIGGEIGLAPERIEGLRLGATIHDIGKVYIPAEILNRPGRLSKAELEMIQTHPEVGYDIVKDVKFPWPVASMILQHHERLDGSGYPKGLKGEDIILEARILAVADVVEAMSSHRPYRPAIGPDKALAEIEQHRGTLYDTAVVDACLKVFREKRFVFG